jgi:hypothetical protein
VNSIKLADTFKDQEVYLPIISRTATEIKAVVVGTKGGANGTYALRYNKKPDAGAATVFPSDMTLNITAISGNQFFTSSTFTSTNVSKGNEASFGIQNGTLNAADYTIKLLGYNYETGVLTEYSAPITGIVADGYDTMDKITFTVPADIPSDWYYVKVTHAGKTLIGGWGYGLNVF